MAFDPYLLMTPAENAEVKQRVKVAVGAKVRKDSDFVVDKLTFIQMALQYVDGVKKVVFEEEYTASTEVAEAPEEPELHVHEGHVHEGQKHEGHDH